MNKQEKSSPEESQELAKKLEECEKNIADYHKRAPAEAKSWAQIEKEELWRYSKKEFKSFIEYKKSKNFSTSYLSRVLRCGYFYLDSGIPDGKEPPETALRPLLKRCYNKADRITIYKNACHIRMKKERGSQTPAEVPDADFTIDVIPNAKDIREAINNWEKKKEGDDIFIKAIAVTVRENGDFVTDVLVPHKSKIHSIATLTTVIKQYTKKNQINSAVTDDINKFAEEIQKDEWENFKAALSENHK